MLTHVPSRVIQNSQRVGAPKSPSVDKRKNRTWSIHTLTVLESMDILTTATTGMDSGDMNALHYYFMLFQLLCGDPTWLVWDATLETLPNDHHVWEEMIGHGG